MKKSITVEQLITIDMSKEEVIEKFKLGCEPYFEGKFMYDIAANMIDISKMVEFIENEYLSNDSIIELECDPFNEYGWWKATLYLRYGTDDVKELNYKKSELVDCLWELIQDTTRFFSWNEV